MSAPSPFPDGGFVRIGAPQSPEPFAYKYDSQGRVYYTVFWPTKTLGPIPMILRVPVASATTLEQAEAAIQSAADTAPNWKTGPVPFPY